MEGLIHGENAMSSTWDTEPRSPDGPPPGNADRGQHHSGAGRHRLIFEVLGWLVRGQSFLINSQRLLIIILQVSIIGLIAIGVTQVIITGGIDLSSGSVVALAAMVAASLAQSSTRTARSIQP